MARAVRLVSLAAAGTLALAGCGQDDGPTTTDNGYTLDLVNQNKLTVCTNLPYVPFQYRDDNGDEVGFDVDLMDLAADEIGVDQEIVDIKFDSIKSGAAMAGGSCDVAAAGITITEEREENITFSSPYFDEVLGFMSPAGEPVETIEQVKDEGLTLGVQAGTTSLDLALDAGLDPVQFEDSGKQQQAIKSGTVDVILQDLPVISEWMETDETLAADFEQGGVVETGFQYGFAFKKDAEQELVDAVDKAIADARESGEYDEIYERWFGSAPK
ncbi:ABC transporter substrate-binding protein [Salininema proteolyticum]|uniref:ABC transporter substrate-binding protein n=1 Tax=Salininema proteolyticum TaxID=1607685 RepID=A0ABV8TXZ8_9ACTN